jgi:hypothetical protein
MHQQRVIGILVALLVVANNAFGQTFSSRAGSPRAEEIVAEALHQAIALEKLPDVRSLLDRDTIEVEAYFKIDTTLQVMLPSFVPFHIDRWSLKPWHREGKVDSSNESTRFHLLIYLTVRSSFYRVELICQPHFHAVDRGKLLLEYKYANGVFELKRLIRSYG